jgi:hypothetical protein
MDKADEVKGVVVNPAGTSVRAEVGEATVSIGCTVAPKGVEAHTREDALRKERPKGGKRHERV